MLCDVQGRISLKGRLSKAAQPTFRGVLRFKDLELVPVDGFVPIRDVFGRADFDMAGFDIRLDKVCAPAKVASGRVRIDGLIRSGTHRN